MILCYNFDVTVIHTYTFRRCNMKVLGNILWFFLGGLWLALGWFILGLLLCITVIGIPFGKVCFEVAKLTLAPFGKRVSLNFGKHPIANLLWVLIFGWGMALGYLASGIICCITIIGIPWGKMHFRLAKFALSPFGMEVV